MIRNSIPLLAAAVLTAGFAAGASAQESSNSDCPEDANTTEGCQMEGADQSERQPVEGGATAPVEMQDGGDGTTTMSGANPEGSGGKPESDGTGSTDSEGGSGGSMDAQPGTESTGATQGQPVEGAATAPVEETDGSGRGSKTMTAPETGSGADGSDDGS